MENLKSKSINASGSNKDLPDNIHDSSEKCKDKTSQNVALLKLKIKDYDINDVTNLSLVKYLQNLSDIGSHTIVELDFLSSYIGIIEFLDENIAQIKLKSRNFVAENKILKANLNKIEKDLHNKECKLIIIEEKKAFYNYIISMSKFDVEKELVDIEYDIWHRCSYDRLALNTALVSKYYRNIIVEISSYSIVEAVDFAMKNLLSGSCSTADDLQSTHQKSLCLLLMAKRCYECNLFNEALTFGLDALKRTQFLQVEKREFMAKVMACISLLYCKLYDSKNAISYALESVKLLDSMTERNNDLKSSLAAHYTNLGYIFCNYNIIKDGIVLMESGVSSYSLMLPEEEIRWMDSLARLAMICNDSSFVEDTMVACEKLIIFFHNKHMCMTGSDCLNKNIFDVAVDAEERRKCCLTYNIEVPSPVVLPKSVERVVSELAILFSKNNLFSGAQILSKWLKYCREVNINRSTKQEAPFFIQLDTVETQDIATNQNLNQGSSTSKMEIKHEGLCLTESLAPQLKSKAFSSKLSSLFSYKSNKLENSIMNDNDNNPKVKKIFKMFKKVS